MADVDGTRGRKSAGRWVVSGAIIIVVAGLALAVARPWHHGDTVRTPMQRSVSAWTQDHPETWAWMQSHWDEMSVMHEHWGDTAWMQTHVADWGWMQDHWNDVSWMHGHWEGMAWMHAGGMMAGSGSGGMIGQ